ncbi:hypothetical protein [Paenibacillus sp. MMS18-CY102]|uniref:hypothetical protein n=1 Tax=Paenibacillus sp. MMS18-CY102 TaxID=2682849 RepID=UPI0013661888|nr:hypothetical protein [Paenibacillus sp. MMS18-CY102]MWC29820.1 hypothetical protein [Paenibacillus sp. MMS18-CY102]
MKITLWLLAALLVLSACGKQAGTKPADGLGSPQEDPYEEQLIFERKYVPILEEEMNKRFPVTDPSVAPFAQYGTYYLDAGDKSRMKFVFLVDREDEETPEIKDLQAALMFKLGSHVEFKESKYSQAELQAAADAIIKIMETKKLIGGWSVGVDVKKEKVKVEAYLSEAVKSELLQAFRPDIVDFQMLGTRIALSGYVIAKQDNRILVADSQSLKGEVYAASWFSNVPPDIENRKHRPEHHAPGRCSA